MIKKITRKDLKTLTRDTILAIMLIGLVSYVLTGGLVYAHRHCKAATSNYWDYRFCMGI